ncbi:DNA ligase 1 [Dorcoceras hygrometricum]|uniref:DNA ligase 1 n=1 Tax=Dorcoceras hygrometricum TaxID=472368 RepID=A0A2Z7CL03_9LAMI|nr:DNA ligase 1 [Dorcoceras hygrometricum]
MNLKMVEMMIKDIENRRFVKPEANVIGLHLHTAFHLGLALDPCLETTARIALAYRSSNLATPRFDVAAGISRRKCFTLFGVLLLNDQQLVLRIALRGRAVIPHSHLPAGIVATMRRVVNYHSSWARQQQVELLYASGNPGSTAGRGFNPAGGAPGGG